MQKVPYKYNSTVIQYVVKKKQVERCHATAYVLNDQNDKHIILVKQHNHPARPIDLDVPLLRQNITEKALSKTIQSYNPHGIYMEAKAKLVQIHFLYIL